MQAALKGAVALCKRHSRDAAAEVAEELWFCVLQSYVALLRQLRHRERAADGASVPPDREANTEVHKERLLLAQACTPSRSLDDIRFSRELMQDLSVSVKAVRTFLTLLTSSE